MILFFLSECREITNFYLMLMYFYTSPKSGSVSPPPPSLSGNRFQNFYRLQSHDPRNPIIYHLSLLIGLPTGKSAAMYTWKNPGNGADEFWADKEGTLYLKLTLLNWVCFGQILTTQPLRGKEILPKNTLSKLEELKVSKSSDLSVTTVYNLIEHCPNLRVIRDMEYWEGVSAEVS